MQRSTNQIKANESGAHDRDRTGDLVLTKDVLYRLSYVGTYVKNRRSTVRKTSSFTSQCPFTPESATGHSRKFRPTVRSMERVMGIEPTPSAWKAEVLPLNYTRTVVEGVGFEPTKA